MGGYSSSGGVTHLTSYGYHSGTNRQAGTAHWDGLPTRRPTGTAGQAGTARQGGDPPNELQVPLIRRVPRAMWILLAPWGYPPDELWYRLSDKYRAPGGYRLLGCQKSTARRVGTSRGRGGKGDSTPGVYIPHGGYILLGGSQIPNKKFLIQLKPNKILAQSAALEKQVFDLPHSGMKNSKYRPQVDAAGFCKNDEKMNLCRKPPRQIAKITPQIH
ncbi:hypothetical protein V9T40_009115 [Parthenolecanium corni]|uniref:Uncharacterized protein n=1 Tax=Parthenolecanium corni TaxID=536013 RepID=A0AAN9TM37_9HEMI